MISIIAACLVGVWAIVNIALGFWERDSESPKLIFRGAVLLSLTALLLK